MFSLSGLTVFLLLFFYYIEIYIFQELKKNGQSFTFLLNPHTLNSQITQRYPEVLWIKFKVTLLSPYELKAQTTQRYQDILRQKLTCLQPLKTNDRSLLLGHWWISKGNFWAIALAQRRWCSNHFFPLNFPSFLHVW